MPAREQGVQAHSINDGEQVNVFQWLQPLFEKLGHSMPRTCVPVHLVYAAALTMEWVHLLLRHLVELPPLLTRSETLGILRRRQGQSRLASSQAQETAGSTGPTELGFNRATCGVGDERELLTRRVQLSRRSLDYEWKPPHRVHPPQVRNVGVTHTFCISKARRQLGCRPREFCLSETLHVPKITRIKTWRTGVARHEALMWAGVLLCFCLLVLHSVVVLLMMF
ncbi:uncharacterized protein LOC133340771 isoform X1 [Lethenteron reissneri]|uniref:uncharacterized protein LOC133340771 isoform X1 n=1 Tax=Lethenteron reissneri TaxID=7753 RepID=UPI002AB6F82A|nr:uncharacterized protein LOC133340771 isoform X1 [Lethenteron reissneri]XP_061405138.1 uncharacterized protein LOC133340771 isoform X1 [Lethenteron reissneri]